MLVSEILSTETNVEVLVAFSAEENASVELEATRPSREEVSKLENVVDIAAEESDTVPTPTRADVCPFTSEDISEGVVVV